MGASTIRGVCFQLKSQSGEDRPQARKSPWNRGHSEHLALSPSARRPSRRRLCLLFHHGLNCAVRGRGAALRPASCPGRRGRVSRSAGYRGYHWLVSAVRVITAAKRCVLHHGPSLDPTRSSDWPHRPSSAAVPEPEPCR